MARGFLPCMLVSWVLASCGQAVPPPPSATDGPEAAQKSYGHLQADVRSRIRARIESPRWIRDFYPKVTSLRVYPVTPGVLYRFEADTQVTMLFNVKRPYRLAGTFHVPTDRLQYTEHPILAPRR